MTITFFFFLLHNLLLRIKKKGDKMAITIGIPKALLYYHYYDLWAHFFEALGCKIIYSPKTNQEILTAGKKYIVDESCLAMKIYMGHLEYLSQSCDYLLIPHLERLNKKEEMCTNFYALHDLATTSFKAKILCYHIDAMRHQTELKAFLKMGQTLGFSKKISKEAYDDAIAKATSLKLEKINANQDLCQQQNLKILLVGHPYNLDDELIGKPVTDYLNKNKITIIYAHLNDNKPLAYKKISKTLYWSFSKELVNGLALFENKVDGIILLSVFPCGPDSLVNDICLRKITKPVIQIIIDELSASAGLETRLESFIDIIKTQTVMK